MFNLRAGLLALLLFLPAPMRAAGALPSQGTYTDAAGGKHPWRINEAHALLWDGEPYLPVGSAFLAQSWGPSPAEEDWSSDVAALALLKERGVTDLYVRPARGGLTGVKPEHIQRLLDHLEAQGFTYGICVNDGPREPLIGHVVRPGAYRQAVAARPGGSVRFTVPDLGAALYFAVGAASGEVLDAGEAALVADGAQAPLPSRSSEAVVFLVPEKIYAPGSGLGLPNLWDGFDRYRDGLLALLGQVNLGKGFRFFLDALPPDLALREEGRRLVPSGRGFQMEWAAWLARKYRHVDALHTAWGLPERDLKKVEEAASLLPLWSGGKGIPAFYDRATGKRLKAAAAIQDSSAFWDDLQAFKAESVRGYMNALADVLKREVADVPVVYRWTGYGPLWENLPADAGFDGIGIEAYGTGAELVTRAAGHAYAQAAEAPKTVWLPVTGTGYPGARPAGGGDGAAAEKPAAGYPSRGALFGDLDWLREIGAKGFFVGGPQAAGPGREGGVDAPEQIAWLRDYKGMLAALSGAAEHRPVVVPYPKNSPAASIRPLSGGGWWLPTSRPATLLDFGPSGRGYALATGQGAVYYLWNPRGPQKIRLRLPKRAGNAAAPGVKVAGAAPGSVKGDILTLTIGPEPVSIHNLPYPPLPLDAFSELLKEAEALAALARKQGPEGTGALFQQQLAFARDRYKGESTFEGVLALQELVGRMRLTLRPYLWIEAEPTQTGQTHSFDETRTSPGASGGAVLAVGARPAASAAAAVYPLILNGTGSYDLWVAASPDAALSFRLDGQPVAPGQPAQTRGASYADGLVWTRIGTVEMTGGKHALEMRADGPATVDALLLIRGDFTPDGPTPPPILPEKPAPPET